MAQQQTPHATQLEAAVEAVRLASRVTRRVHEQLVTPETLEKKDRSPVTVADYASQAVVCRRLGEALGEVAIVGEEDAAELRSDENAPLRAAVTEHVRAVVGDGDENAVLEWINRGGAPAAGEAYWTLDPIDGTKGFLRNEQYAIALALIENGEVTLGVLGCPSLPTANGIGTLLIAVRGKGASQIPLDGQGLDNAQPVRVSDVTDPTQARFCESVESAHSDQSASAQIASRLGIAHEPVRMDSQAKYAAVARGEAQIYLRLPTRADYRENIWDHAAGAIVVAEAGGRVTDIHGRPLDFSKGARLEANAGVVASNGPLHEAVIEAVGAGASD